MFIAARDELVRRLRESDRAQDAAAVKALRKPTVVTWTLNQLGVRDPDGVAALLDAGSEVRSVQRAALSSTKGAADRLKVASASRRTAITGLTDSARAVLEEAGRASPQHLDAIRRALETASTDPDAGEHLRLGTFERAPDGAAGFGDLAGLTLVPSLSSPTPADAPGGREVDRRPGRWKEEPTTLNGRPNASVCAATVMPRSVRHARRARRRTATPRNWRRCARGSRSCKASMTPPKPTHPPRSRQRSTRKRPSTTAQRDGRCVWVDRDVATCDDAPRTGGSEVWTPTD